MRRPLFALLLCPVLLLAVARAQDAPPPAPAVAPDLLTFMQSLDSKLFTAVNSCDLKTVSSMLAEDVEFYHDHADPQYGRDVVVGNIQKTFCGGNVVRVLVPGSLEAHRIQNYGAVEIGVHRFLHPNAADHGVIGEAKFIHLWRKKDGQWQITRVISYDHGTVK